MTEEEHKQLPRDVDTRFHEQERRDGHSRLVYNKATRTIDTVDTRPSSYYDGEGRPPGSNADEWHLFLSVHCCSRPNQVNGLTYMAVQIAEAIDAAEKRTCLDKIADKAREWASHYPQSSDGRNTFVLFAEWVEGLAPTRSHKECE